MRLLALALACSALPVGAQTLARLRDRQITSEEVRGGHSEAVKYIAMTLEETFGERYLRDNGLEPPAAVLDTLRQKLRPPNVRPDDRMVELFVQRIARSYYLYRALWQKHGGRVVLSAFGPCVAKDALVTELRALEASGALTFPGGQTLRDDVYRHIDQMSGDGVISGERARKFFAKPVWEQ
jgi:hypothetical protein